MFSQREKTTSLVKKTPTAFPKWKAAHKWDNPFEPPTGNNGEDPLDPLADLILPRGQSRDENPHVDTLIHNNQPIPREEELRPKPRDEVPPLPLMGHNICH